MGLINLDPTLHAGERVLWRRPAALSLSDRVVAGVLYLTSEALLFMPNRFNRRCYIVSTRVPRDQIKRLDTIDPAVSLGSLRNGGLRRRLRVTAADDEVHLFVINRLEGAVAELRAALRESPGPT